MSRQALPVRFRATLVSTPLTAVEHLSMRISCEVIYNNRERQNGRALDTVYHPPAYRISSREMQVCITAGLL
ncbi:hypothetical protein BWQ96_08803 [Gracilariopsis chorda]|uniref:Uncharacterized protein n=1 Tax=Gracilariopsis chorda TaxID=448386 RepID=A0A2V3IHB2_9FLOR|nr:hypothetical protein BWQ96_08803 [Gracilariopsis chorda]|eukprot:PXF41496.1 hypothetical protein BWQ96_08803 [Gracilariopsis chorda]